MEVKTSNRLRAIRVAVLVMLWLRWIPGLRAQEIVLLDEIVAKVNDEIITLTDLKNELRLLRANLRQENPDPELLERAFQNQKRSVLKTVIQNKMLVQRAEEFGITADIDMQVASTIEEVRKASGIPDMEVLDQYLRRQGSSLEEYRSSLKQRMIIDLLLQQFVYSKLTLLTPEIEAYYNEHIDRFTEKAEVELKEILFLKEGKEVERVRRKAEEVLDRLQSSASFEDLAKEYSEGPTASRGGDIGSFKKGAMAAPIEEVVFQLEEGEVSGIIETEYGLQIFKVVSKKAARKKPMEEVRPEITRALYQQKAQPELREFMNELREQSYVYVAPKYREEYDVEDL